MNNIITGQEAKDRLLAGTKIIADAVLSTYGPNGHNVIIQKDGSRFITKDGVSVAKEIYTENPFENETIQMLKEACVLTNTQAGDGTTTSMLFANTIITEGMKSDVNGITLKRQMEAELPLILERIDNYKRNCTLEDIKNIAMVSTNGDKVATSIVEEVFTNNITADILFDKSETSETTTEFVKGYSVDGSVYEDRYDYLDSSLEDCRVYTIDGRIDNFKKFGDFLHTIKNTGEKVIIIAEMFSKDIMNTAFNNMSLVNVKFIKSPGYSTGRLASLENIAAYTGQPQLMTPNQFYDGIKGGHVETFSNKNGRLVFFNENKENKQLVQRIKFLNTKLEATLDGFEKQQLSNLISKFESGISVIKIGAKSDIEFRELHDKLEDAVNACKSALKDGIVFGGGITAKEVAEDITNPILVKALTAPYELLGKYDKDEIVENKIYDPVYVLKCAITNAIAVAGTILTTNTIVLNNE